MAQNSINIDGVSGIDVRSDINDAIETLITNYSGPSQPSPIYPYMWWIDTANSLIKQAKADASGFVTKGVLLADGTVQWTADLAGVLASGNLLSTNVQGQLVELDSRNGYMSGFKNKIINADNELSQRGSSFVLAAGAAGYTTDRTYVHNGTNQSITVTHNPYTSWEKSTRIYRTSSNPTTGNVTIHHCIEGVKTLSISDRGVGKATLYAEVDGYDPTAKLVQSFGTGGSPSVDVETNFTLTKTSLGGSVNKFVGAVDVPSVASKTLGTAGDDYLELVITIPLRSAECHILFRQLEEGSVNTHAERLAPGVNLRNCQRYYEKSFLPNIAPAQNAGTNGVVAFHQILAASTGGLLSGYVPFKVQKRGQPIITPYNPGAVNGQIRNITRGSDCSSTSIWSLVDYNGFIVQCTTAAGSSVGDQLIFHWTAESEL